jgi:hypothetical protein
LYFSTNKNDFEDGETQLWEGQYLGDCYDWPILFGQVPDYVTIHMEGTAFIMDEIQVRSRVARFDLFAQHTKTDKITKRT